ncbi:hypothetical protein [Halomonas sp. QHL1]|uniref:hypothetical protein n=1 Tax=Halomonas sp. QHL1 TaxID=1123773 RepID=UPI000A6AE356|nr:hypothetical protein [Halomonas sp. QHL1]
MYFEEGVIKVRYDGDGGMMNNHQMNAGDVARSIKAMEIIYVEAFRESNKIFKTNINAEVILEAGFQEGSLWWLLKMIGKSNEEQKAFGSKTSFLAISEAIKKYSKLLKSFLSKVLIYSLKKL